MKRIEFAKQPETREEIVNGSLSLSVDQRLQILESFIKLGRSSGIDPCIFDERQYIVIRKK